MTIIKYDSAIRSRLLELSALGYTYGDMARLLGVHRNTITRWIARDNLADEMLKVKRESIVSALEQGLLRLAKGAETTETIKEYTDEATGERVTEKIRIIAPSEKAIQILAQKYEKIFAATSNDAESQSTPLVTINVPLRELQGDSPLGSVLDAEYHEVDVKGQVVLGPPSKDSE